MNTNQLLAVWGGPGVGKTTTAVKVAMELAKHKKNVVILMCNFTVPAPQTILPGVTTEGKSLGDLLSLPSISQDDILSRCIPFGKSQYISLLGYKNEDNAFTYAKYSKERAIDLITLLRHIADYVIIDCESIISFDVLSAVSLENADAVLRLCSCDLRSLSYFKSALPLLADARYNSARHIKALSIVKPGQDSGEYENAFGGISYSLPYVQELEEQLRTGQIMDVLCTTQAEPYNANIRGIANNVLLGIKPEAKQIKAPPNSQDVPKKRLAKDLSSRKSISHKKSHSQHKSELEKKSKEILNKLGIGKGGGYDG